MASSRAAALAVVIASAAAPAGAQPTSPPAPTPLTRPATVPAEALRGLPAGESLFALLETTLADVVTDRFSSGGLNAGGTARAAGFLASWRQTAYRVGDIDIAGPADGAPMFVPDLSNWREVQVSAGAMPPDLAAPGLAVTLEPRRPGPRWTRVVDASGSGGWLASSPPGAAAPAIARLHDWTYGSVSASGPVTDRLGAAFGGEWARHAVSARGRAPRGGERRSALAHLVGRLAGGREWRTLGWVQHATDAESPGAGRPAWPLRRDVAVHLQSTLAREAVDGWNWRVAAGYTRHGRTSDGARPDTVVVDRLADGPVSAIALDGDLVEHRWSLSTRASTLAAGRHRVQAGAAIEARGSRSTSHDLTIGERVNGIPARIWAYTSPGQPARRRAWSLRAFVADRLSLSPEVSLEGSVTADIVHGRAERAPDGIAWRTLLPSVQLQWDLGTRYGLAWFTGYRRAAHDLRLDVLAYGDPAAPTASVYRWDGSPDVRAPVAGTLLGRVGPGTAGHPAFSRLDPDLGRPITDEFAVGLESRARPALLLRIAGLARRQSPLVTLQNVGVSAGAYETITIRDAYVDLINPSDDRDLPIFDRRPDSFGTDAYLLTDRGTADATMGALVVSAQAATGRLFVLIGASASASVGPGGAPGFKVTENDHDAIGTAFSPLNASTYARGRLFTDRAYTIKWTTIYRFPRDIRLGAIARYQDGQPFSRLVVAPGLRQGAEAVQAFPNGRSRFAFTGTLDARLLKGFAAGRTRVEAMIDVYNLLQMRKAVEEDVVTGPGFRTTTGVQPPRSVHVGLRLSF